MPLYPRPPAPACVNPPHLLPGFICSRSARQWAGCGGDKTSQNRLRQSKMQVPALLSAVQVGWRSRGREGVVLHLCLTLADGALVAPGFLFVLVFRTPFLLLWTCCGCRRPRPLPSPPSPICFQNTESSAVFQFRNRALSVPFCDTRLGCWRV